MHLQLQRSRRVQHLSLPEMSGLWPTPLKLRYYDDNIMTTHVHCDQLTQRGGRLDGMDLLMLYHAGMDQIH